MSKKDLKAKLLREVTRSKEGLDSRKKAVKQQHDSDMKRVDAELAELKVKEDAFKSIKV